MSIFYSFVTSLFYLFFLIFYRLRVYGASHVGKGGAIIAPNHASFFDPPLIGAACPQEAHFLARDSLFKHRWLSFFITKMNAHPVKRNSRDLTSFKVIEDLLKSGNKVVIFPEGERTEDGEMGAFKVGAALLAMRCESVIIPVYIHGSYKAFPKGKRYPVLFGKMACVFGSPISSRVYEGMDKKVAQQKMTEDTKEAISGLRKWYLEGAFGEPP